MRIRARYGLFFILLATLTLTAVPAEAQKFLRTIDTPNPNASAWFGLSVAAGDINGDGKEDIAVASPIDGVDGDTVLGHVHAFSGSNGSLLFSLDTPNLYVAGGGAFTHSVAVGDVNGDGKGDIVVGTPWEDVGGNGFQGRVHVFSGATGDPLFTLDTPNQQSYQGRFGNSVAVGDVNGDGKDDIAVGAFYENVPFMAQGRVYVFSGATHSLLYTLNTPQPGNGEFGFDVAVGDVNGDGRADIAVGARLEDAQVYNGPGRAYVFSGSTGSLLFVLDTPNPQSGHNFGYSLAVGDVNGDGKKDITVGADAESVDGNNYQGRAYVFSGISGSLLLTLDTPHPQKNAFFGASLVTKDVNGDGKADIAINAYEDVNGRSAQGRVYVFSGGDGSLLFTLDTPNPQPEAYFGDGLAMGDVNGDGTADIAVGAPHEDVDGNTDRGRAYVFWNPPAWRLPWAEGETWYYYCGPHSTTNSCPNGPTREALDFGPTSYGAATQCHTGNEVDSSSVVRSVGSGRIFEVPGQTYPGQYKIELGRWAGPPGSRSFTSSGNMAVYEHVVADPVRAVGDEVAAGDPLGHPSCLGVAPVIHLHIGFYKCSAPADCAIWGNWTPNSFPGSGIALSGWSVGLSGTLERGSCTAQQGSGYPDSAVICPKTQAPALVQQTLPLAQGQTKQLSASMPSGQTRMSAFFGLSGSNINAWLTAPDDTVIDQASASSDVLHIKGDAFEYYEVRSPQAGEWTFHVYGADLPPDGENVDILVSSESSSAVGGIADLPDAHAYAAATKSSQSAPNTLTIAGFAAGGVLLLAAGGWYARRRRLA